jgi:hypothetical protein
VSLVQFRFRWRPLDENDDWGEPAIMVRTLGQHVLPTEDEDKTRPVIGKMPVDRALALLDDDQERRRQREEARAKRLAGLEAGGKRANTVLVELSRARYDDAVPRHGRLSPEERALRTNKRKGQKKRGR